MPVHIDEIVADVEPEPDEGARGHEGGAAGGGGEKDNGWFCAELQRQRMALERRERLRVD